MTEYFLGFFMLQFALVLSLVQMNIQANIKKAKCKIVQGNWSNKLLDTSNIKEEVLQDLAKK